MNGPMNGTFISELNEKDQYENIRNLTDMQNSQYGAMQNLQYEQGHNAPHTIQQAQHDAYYRSQMVPQNTCAVPNMEDLARDISRGMPAEAIEGVDFAEDDASSKDGMLSFLPEVLREPVILIVLFLVISHPIVQEKLAVYIPQTAPDATGKFSFTSVLIYGVILATLFVLAKKLLMK